MRSLRHLLCLALLSCLAACGGSASENADTSVTADTTVFSDTADDSEVQAPPPIGTESFTAAWLATDRYSTDAPALFSITHQGGQVNNWTNILDCTNGCVPSPTLDAVLQVDSQTVDGASVTLVQVSPSLVLGGKTTLSTGALNWRFDGGFLYLFEKQGSTFNLFRISTATPQSTAQLTAIAAFKPSNADSYRGGFVVRKGQVVVLYATIGGAELHHLDTTKNGATFQKIASLGEGQGGTGSQYSESDPLAIAPDGSKLVYFVSADNKVSAWVRSLTGGNPLGPITFTPKQLYGCNAASSTGNYIRPVGTPAFSPDGKTIYFLVSSKDNLAVTEACKDYKTASSTTVIRPETDILRIDTSLAASTLKNLTQNPKLDDESNMVLDDFVLGPQGKTLVLIGSPANAGNNRSRSDREIWRLNVDGGDRVQLTDDGKWLPLAGSLVAR